MNTLFVNNLTVIDFSYLDADLGLLGESWSVDIELDGSLDHQGMVLDFGNVKKQVKQLIDQEFDHRLLLPAAYPGCSTSSPNHRSRTRFILHTGETIEHDAPNSAIAELAVPEITTKSLAQEICRRLQPELPDNVKDLRITLTPEAEDGAWYRYSHGLKHHAGNCQRIAHGHRSRIRILRDGKRDEMIEADWAKRLENCYIGTRSDLSEELNLDGIDYYRFSYTANQGLFEMTLPKRCCYLIDSDSTVENLAQHFAECIKRECPDNVIKVIAYEGIGKGAIGQA